MSRLSSDVTLIRTMLTQTMTSLLSSLIGLVGSVLILFTLSPTLLLVALLLAPALLAVAILFGRPLQRVAPQVQDAIAHSTATAEEALGGIRVVKSYVREDYEVDALRPRPAGRRRARAPGSRCGGPRSAALMGFLGFGAIAVLLWYTGHEVIDGPLAIGTLTGFLLYGITIGASLAHDREPVRPVPRGHRRRERVFEIIDTEPTVVDAPGAVPLGRVTGRIELDARHLRLRRRTGPSCAR